jgi:hypothetical protein
LIRVQEAIKTRKGLRHESLANDEVTRDAEKDQEKAAVEQDKAQGDKTQSRAEAQASSQ